MTPVQTATCPICRSGLNPKGECVGCLLRVGLGALSDAEGSTDLRRFFGDFEIACREDGSLWELGRGAMGVTYRAMDTVLHRAVALKVIGMPDGMAQSPPVRERFLREARCAASLHHPNVAEVFQFGTAPETDQVYYAMELIDGETLEDRVRREGSLRVDTALEVAVQVARALAAAAERGLVHRDVKPGNIMLSRAGALTALRATIIDFGLAKTMTVAENGASSTHGGFVGTPAFASPEQFRGEPADARSDIYALGATLWFALTGRAPFTGKTLDELRDHPARVALPVKQLTARKVPTRLVNILRGALALDPAARPASARELLAALEACRRRRVGRAVGIALAVAAMATVAAAGWAYRRPPSVPAAVSGKSIAVLPFQNLSADEDNAFFADGMQDEVMTDLSKVADLKVISRTSVMGYKDTKRRDLREIGKALDVAYVVEGSVQRAGNKIRVVAQLIDARTDTHRWAETYDRDLTDVFTIQSEIAQAVTGQLQAIISPREQAAMDEVPTHDEQAYQLYLRALVRANDPNLTDDEVQNDQTIDLLRQATERDPNFSRAFALMAEVQSSTYIHTRKISDGEKVRVYAEAVARLRPGSADAHVAMACYDYEVRRDYVHAHEELTTVARQVPNDARASYYLGLVERRQGNWKESMAHMRRAMELDPENSDYFADSCNLMTGLRLFPELLTLIDRRLASHPAMVLLHVNKADALLDWKADTRAARGELALVPPGADSDCAVAGELLMCDWYDRDFAATARDSAACPPEKIFGEPRALTEADIACNWGDAKAAAVAYYDARPHIEEALREHPRDYDILAILARMDARLGRKEIALEEGQRMKSMVTPNDTLDAANVAYQWARVLTLAGQNEEAIRTLQTICGQPYGPQYGSLRACPQWDALRGDPRFEMMVASLAPKP